MAFGRLEVIMLEGETMRIMLLLTGIGAAATVAFHAGTRHGAGQREIARGTANGTFAGVLVFSDGAEAHIWRLGDAVMATIEKPAEHK